MNRILQGLKPLENGVSFRESSPPQLLLGAGFAFGPDATNQKPLASGLSVEEAKNPVFSDHDKYGAPRRSLIVPRSIGSTSQDERLPLATS